MEPIIVLVLGVVSLMGQLHNYGIDVEKNPDLKDIRVRRDLQSQLPQVKDNNYGEISTNSELIMRIINNRDNEKVKFLDVENKDTEIIQPSTLGENYEKEQEFHSREGTHKGKDLNKPLDVKSKDYELQEVLKKNISFIPKIMKLLRKRYTTKDQLKRLVYRFDKVNGTLNNSHESPKADYDSSNVKKYKKHDYNYIITPKDRYMDTFQTLRDRNDVVLNTVEKPPVLLGKYSFLYRQKRSSSYQQTQSISATASQTSRNYASNLKSGIGNTYYGYNTETTKHTGYNIVTESYNEYSSLYGGYNDGYSGNAGYNSNIRYNDNNGYSGNKGYNGNNGYSGNNRSNGNYGYYGIYNGYNGSNNVQNININNPNNIGYNNQGVSSFTRPNNDYSTFNNLYPTQNSNYRLNTFNNGTRIYSQNYYENSPNYNVNGLNYNENNPNYNTNITNYDGYAFTNGSNWSYNNTLTSTQKSKITSTTQNIQIGSVFGNIGCPDFMKRITLFGKPLCVPDKGVIEVAAEDYDINY